MKRVVAYCRVSTDKDDQVNSLISQKKYFKEYIERNPDWELIDLYVDEGISGTNTKKRLAFNKMIIDAENNRFDLIVTKEISRFARNTLDSIFYTRKLKDLNIGVLFLNDNINTIEPDAELRLTIMSSIAQEESRKTSSRVKWGQKRRMEQGVVFGREMYGYDLNRGILSINIEEAEVVKLVYHKFINEGKGTHTIARELKEAGIQTKKRVKNWSNTVILRMLRNEKYVGDLKQKKTVTLNYLSHTKTMNKGEEDFVTIHDHHEPIIDKGMFERVQKELLRRKPSEESLSKHSNRYCFSGKIKCGFCGNSFVSRKKKNKDGTLYSAWKCGESAKNGSVHIDPYGVEVGCDGRQISNITLLQLMKQVVIDVNDDKTNIINSLKKVIADNIYGNDKSDNINIENEIEKINVKKQDLISLFLDGTISKSDLGLMNTKFDQDLNTLNHKLDFAEAQNNILKHQEEDLKKMVETITNIIDGENFDEEYYKKILEKIVVYDRNTVDVYICSLPKMTYNISGISPRNRGVISMPI